jgi:hypothetical protein
MNRRALLTTAFLTGIYQTTSALGLTKTVRPSIIDILCHDITESYNTIIRQPNGKLLNPITQRFILNMKWQMVKQEPSKFFIRKDVDPAIEQNLLRFKQIEQLLSKFEHPPESREIVHNIERTEPMMFGSLNDANNYLWAQIEKQPVEREGNWITAGNRLGMCNRRGYTGWIVSPHIKRNVRSIYKNMSEYWYSHVHECAAFSGNNEGMVFYRGNCNWDSTGNYYIHPDGKCSLLLQKGIPAYEGPKIHYMYKPFTWCI